MALPQAVVSILACLFLLYNNPIEGTNFAKFEAKQTEAKERRSIESHSRIIPRLLGNLSDDQSSDGILHRATWYTGSYVMHGTRARISVWGLPDVSANSQSMVFISAINDNGPHYAMSAGFHVYPGLYSANTDLRLFTDWDNNGKGCYNTDCEGFVLSNISGAPFPGQKFEPTSSFDGKDYFVTLSIKKDEKTQDWSLYRDDDKNPVLIGWWPKTLFDGSFDSANKIAWGGAVIYSNSEKGPPMGSGHAAAEGANRAAYVSHIKLFDHNGDAAIPDKDTVSELTDRNDCYTTDGFRYDAKKRFYFYYGGPAGCVN